MENRLEPHPSAVNNNFEKVKLFGLFLVKAINAIHKKNSEISEEIGVSSALINKWHNDQVFPRPEKLPAIAKAYNVSLEDLTNIFDISIQAHNSLKGGRKRINLNPTNR